MQLSIDFNKGANLYMICMHIVIPAHLFGLADARKSHPSSFEVQLINVQAIRLAMDMPDR
ncbi:hypothetical protein CJ419_18430 [Vibrio navarrensis]|nr:hypothetical protein [Vibrio navarrensis]